MRILLDKKCVLFNPSATGFSPELYNKLETNLNNLFLDVDIVFNPIYNDFIGKTEYRRTAFYKPYINLHQPMLFRPESRSIDFISMCSSLDNLSNMIANGSYEFMSLTRCAFLLPSKHQYKVQSGGSTNDVYHLRSQNYLQQKFDDYIDGFESNYHAPPTSGKKRSRKKKLRIHKKFTQKIKP